MQPGWKPKDIYIYTCCSIGFSGHLLKPEGLHFPKNLNLIHKKNPCRSMPMIQTFLEFSLVVPKCRRFLNLVEGPTLDFFPRTNGLGFPSTFRPTLWCLQSTSITWWRGHTWASEKIGWATTIQLDKKHHPVQPSTWPGLPPKTSIKKHEISWNNHSLKIRRFSVTSTNH